MNFEYKGYRCESEWGYESQTWCGAVRPTTTYKMSWVEKDTPSQFYTHMKTAIDEYEAFVFEMRLLSDQRWQLTQELL